MRPIFLVTSKKATELLEVERLRKGTYHKRVTRKLKKVLPEISHAVIQEVSWSASIRTVAVVFKDDHKLDLTKWVKQDRVVVKSVYKQSYWPKRNTKAGKDLANKLHNVSKSEDFFQHKDIANILQYHPSKIIMETGPGRITNNILNFGYEAAKDKPTKFMFAGYPGYKAPRGVKELTVSQYNKIIGEK